MILQTEADREQKAVLERKTNTKRRSVRVMVNGRRNVIRIATRIVRRIATRIVTRIAKGTEIEWNHIKSHPDAVVRRRNGLAQGKWDIFAKDVLKKSTKKMLSSHDFSGPEIRSAVGVGRVTRRCVTRKIIDVIAVVRHANARRRRHRIDAEADHHTRNDVQIRHVCTVAVERHQMELATGAHQTMMSPTRIWMREPYSACSCRSAFEPETCKNSFRALAKCATFV